MMPYRRNPFKTLRPLFQWDQLILILALLNGKRQKQLKLVRILLE